MATGKADRIKKLLYRSGSGGMSYSLLRLFSLSIWHKANVDLSVGICNKTSQDETLEQAGPHNTQTLYDQRRLESVFASFEGQKQKCVKTNTYRRNKMKQEQVEKRNNNNKKTTGSMNEPIVCLRIITQFSMEQGEHVNTSNSSSSVFF